MSWFRDSLVINLQIGYTGKYTLISYLFLKMISILTVCCLKNYTAYCIAVFSIFFNNYSTFLFFSAILTNKIYTLKASNRLSSKLCPISSYYFFLIN